MRKFLSLALFFLAAHAAFGQSTSVSATVTDAGGQTWNSGSYTFTFYPAPINPGGPYFWTGGTFNPNQQITGPLTSTGQIATVAIPSNSAITPAGSQWSVTVCPAATATCYTKTMTITGVTQNISASLTPPALSVKANNTSQVSSYTDTAISGAILGTTYFNLTDNTVHLCTIQIPCTWVSLGSGGGAGNPAAPGAAIQFANAGVTGFSTVNCGGSFLSIDNISSPTTLIDPCIFEQVGNSIFGGPNPYFDITAPPYNARSATINTTGTGSGTALVVGASTFKNLDGITIAGAGNLPAIATPSGLAVSPGFAGGPTVPDSVMIASSTGSSTYQYVIFSCTIADGCTTPTSVVTTTTAAASLGKTTSAISTWSLTGNTLSITTTAANNFPAGTWVHITGTSNNSLAGGWYPISTAGTTFTVSNVPQYSATTVSGTGGNAVSMIGNTLTWNPSTGGTPGTLNMPWEYFVCAQRPGDGSLHIVGRSFPSTFYAETNSGNFSTTFVDFGSTITANPLIPWDISNANCTAGSPQREMFTTTVSAGGGGTALTLANSMPGSVTSANVRKDDAVAFLAAANAAHNVGGTFYIPILSSGFVINSPVNMPFATAVSQAGALTVNVPIIVKGSVNWSGAAGIAPTTAFGFNGSSVITCNAYPCIYVGDIANQANGGTTFDTITMTSPANGLDMLVDANWGMIWNKANLQSGTGNNDNMGISLAIRPGAASYSVLNSSFSGGPNQVIDQSWTPLFFTDRSHPSCCGGAGGVGTVIMNNIEWNRRGFYALTNGGDGLHFTATIRQYSQGGITPRFVAQNTNGNVGGQIEIDNAFHDTESQAEYAWICNVGCSGGFGVPTYLGFVNQVSQDTGTVPNEVTGGGNQGIMMIAGSFSPSGTLINGSFGAVPTGYGWIYSAGRLTPSVGLALGSQFGTFMDIQPNVPTPQLSLESGTFFGNFTAPGLTATRSYTGPDASGFIVLGSAPFITGGCLQATGPFTVTTPSSANCGTGGGSGNFQVNGTPLISATTVNFQNSAAFNGVTFTFSNPSLGNVQLGASGTFTNSALLNSSTTVNGQNCVLGATCTIPFAVNSVNNASQSGLSVLNSSTNAAGLTLTWTNPTTNQIQGEITGIANQAAALAALGTQCTGGNFATGIDVHGNANCSIPSASGNVTNGGTSFTVPGGSIIASNNIATVFSSSAYLDCSSPAFTAADWGLIARSCLSALNTLNSTAGIADMRGVPNSTTASVNPEGSTMPASGKMLMGPGTYPTNVPFVSHADWSIEGISVRGLDTQVGTTIKAGASFQATYNTGTITVGTPGVSEVITGAGTTWTSSMIGCAFYGANGATNSTFGIITAVGGATSLTLGWGQNNGTGAAGGSSYSIVCPIYVHGSGGASSAGAQFGMFASNINFDCNAVAGCIGELNWFGQQGTGSLNVGIHNSTNIGFDLENQFQNSGPWDRTLVAMGTGCAASALPMVIHGNGQFFRGILNPSISRGACATSPSVGIDVAENGTVISGADIGTVGIGILFGANTACPIACAMPGRLTNGWEVDNIYLESTGTTAVESSNANGANQGFIVRNISNAGTNALIDLANACTDATSRVGTYVANADGSIGYSTSLTAACEPKKIDLNPITVSGLTASPPTGSVAVVQDGINGADCTTGGGSTLVWCRFAAGVWSAIAGSGSVGTGTTNAVTIWTAPTTLGSVLGTITGQVLTAQNGNPPIFAGPGLAGTFISSASPYTVQCDSGTTQLDRLKTLVFTAAAGVTVTVPDAGSPGCGANYTFTLVAGPGVGTVTVNRTSSSSFTIVNGTTALSAQTTFNLTVGQSATLNSYDNSNYLVRIPGGSGGSSVTLQTNGVNNSVQTTYNLINSAAFNGLTVTATNTIGGTVQLGLSGTLGNSGLTNPSTTVNGQSCALGGTCTIPFQTNSVNDTSQNGINLLSGAATNGVTITVTNTASNQVQVGISGTLNNSGLTNSATTVNAQNCTLGATCTINPPLDKSTNGLSNPTADATFTYPAASVSGLTLAGTAPASVSTSTGTAASTLFQVNGVVGGATSNATGTGGVGSQPTLAAGNGGAGTGTNAVGGAGGNFTVTAGNGGASNGTGANSNGGNFIVNLGTAGTGGSGAAGAPGLFELNGVGAGAYGYDQGADNCVKILAYIVTGACMEAPSSGMTNYRGFIPPVAATGVITNNVSAAVDTQGFSGDSGHSATVTIGSGTSIGSTSLCSTAICPVGTYDISVYVDITTACGTSGTYIVNLIYTDDQGSKTVPVNLQGTGAVPLTGTLTTTSTSNFGQQVQVIRSTGAASINYSTTATACGTAGPMVGKLYLSATPKQ